MERLEGVEEETIILNRKKKIAQVNSDLELDDMINGSN